jgi:hypothetical protein
MPKTYNLKEPILEMLKENDLSLKTISNRVKEQSDEEILDKTINESLMGLLKEGRIEIIDYDFDVYGRRRMQSIKIYGIVFGSVKTGPFEIEVLIRQLESDDLKKAMKAHKILKKKFKMKIREIENEEEMKWEKLKKKLVCKPFNIFLSEYIDEPRDDLKKEFKNQKRLKNAKILFFENTTSDTKELLDKKNKDLMAFYLDNKNYTKEEKLKLFGHIPPKKMTTNDLDILFEKIIDHINPQELIPKKNLLHNLKVSLSDDKESARSLKKIINCIDL